MNNKKYYKTYCTGCGLCKSVQNVKINMNKKGFLEPDIKDVYLQKKVCPVNGEATRGVYAKDIWGPRLSTKIGWASDKKIRKKASSGGILTSIACWFLKSGKADAILQTKVNSDNPITTEFTCSDTIEQVLECCGSRYAESAPLMDILSYLKENKKYVFIGKPCDVQVLRKYLEDKPELNNKIVCYLSFFCAGIPSYNANKKLIKKMGCNVDDLSEFNYRGNGWPGFATAVDKHKKTYKMDYNSSWGQVLGRDKRKFCRLCMDGIGLFADIACGDAWYKTSDNEPDFSEHDGRNIIFVRTERGAKILREVELKGDIHIEKEQLFEEDLKYIQKYQYERRGTYLAQWLALKLTFHSTPKMNLKNVWKLSKNISFRRQFNIFWGTLKRIYRGRYK